MGSFLSEIPCGILDGDEAPETVRNRLIDGALEALEEDLDRFDAWTQFGAFATGGGLSPTHVERLDRLLGPDGLRLARLAQAMEFVIWRAILTPLADADAARAMERALQLARACRWLNERPVAGDGWRPEAVGAAEELVEIAAMLAGVAGGGADERFSELLKGYLDAWPAVRPVLARVADNLAMSTPSSRVGPLWRLHLYARATA